MKTNTSIKLSFVRSYYGLSKKEFTCLLAYALEYTHVLENPNHIRAIRSLQVKGLAEELGGLSRKGYHVAWSIILWKSGIDSPVPSL